MVQTKLNHENKIPTRSDLNKKLKNVTSAKYNDYFLPIFRFFKDLKNDQKVPVEDIYEVIQKEVSNDTKWKYITRSFMYRPTLAKHLLDRLPPADILVAYSAKKCGYDRNEINKNNLNEIQKECENFANEIKEDHIDYHVERIRKKTESKFSYDISSESRIPYDKFRGFLNKFAEIVAEELPEKLNSMSQARVNIGGKANEIITIKTLISEGLEKGKDFEDVSGDAGEDLHIYVNDKETLHIEIKSLKVRERSGKGVLSIPDPTFLFGYFDDPQELRGNTEILLKGCEGVYVPPTTLQKIKEIDERKDESIYKTEKNGNLFYRTNNIFAADMKNYVENGELLDIDLGHELEYIKE